MTCEVQKQFWSEQRRSGPAFTVYSGTARPLLGPASPEVFNFRFAAEKAFRDKFERLAEVLGVEHPERNMARVFEEALEIALEKKDPERKRERRLAREKKHASSRKAGPPCPGKAGKVAGEAGEARKTAPRPGKVARSRHVPVAVREDVLARAGYRCEFVGADGTRCTQRTGLEVDHRTLFSRGRPNDRRNLRALCGRHNRFAAAEVLGADFVAAKIAERTRQVSRE